MNKVSIIIPAFNAEKYIRQAIQSALKQTYKDLEIIVVDDGSTDNTMQVVKEFDQVRTISNEKNLGLSATINKGLSYATGYYYTKLDADDFLDPRKIEKQVEFLTSNKDYSAVGTKFVAFKKDGTATVPSWQQFDNDKINKNYCSPHFRIMVCVGTLLAKIDDIQAVGGFDEEFKWAEDLEFIVRFCNKGYKVANLQDPLYYYRLHEDQMTERLKSEYDTKAIIAIHDRVSKGFYKK